VENRKHTKSLGGRRKKNSTAPSMSTKKDREDKNDKPPSAAMVCNWISDASCLVFFKILG
jgi:hypothetical protein